ncbi:MAG: hypothetical protein BWY05_00328 [Euryarchaeota archaeon ADurb.Bin165]|nr:MAG: hypothetical protein BWY05_00328 [Euryarchaeota archaeon ADurb.Bin165]
MPEFQVVSTTITTALLSWIGNEKVIVTSFNYV